MTAARNPEMRSTPELANDVLNDVTLLMKSEGELARAEVKGSVTQALAGIGSLLVAVGVFIVGLTIVMISLALGLTAWFGLAPWLAHLITGGITLAVGGVLVMGAKAALSPENLAPTRTAENLKKDARVVRESI